MKLHKVPKSKQLRKKWLAFCGIAYNENENSPIFVCSKHFRPDDYHNFSDPDIRRRILSRDGLYTICNTFSVVIKSFSLFLAIPSIRDPIPDNPSERRKSREQLVNSLLRKYQGAIEREPPEVVLEPRNEAIEPSNISLVYEMEAFPDDSGCIIPCRLDEDTVQNQMKELVAPLVVAAEDIGEGSAYDFSQFEQPGESIEVSSFNPDMCSTFIEHVEANIDPEYNLKLICDAIRISESIRDMDDSSSKRDEFHFFRETASLGKASMIRSEVNRKSTAKLNTLIGQQRQTIRSLRYQVIIIRLNTLFVVLNRFVLAPRKKTSI